MFKIGDHVTADDGRELVVIDTLALADGGQFIVAERVVTDAERATLDALLLRPAQDAGRADFFRPTTREN